jgi:hypothetical protein
MIVDDSFWTNITEEDFISFQLSSTYTKFSSTVQSPTSVSPVSKLLADGSICFEIKDDSSILLPVVWNQDSDTFTVHPDWSQEASETSCEDSMPSTNQTCNLDLTEQCSNNAPAEVNETCNLDSTEQSSSNASSGGYVLEQDEEDITLELFQDTEMCKAWLDHLLCPTKEPAIPPHITSVLPENGEWIGLAETLSHCMENQVHPIEEQVLSSDCSTGDQKSVLLENDSLFIIEIPEDKNTAQYTEIETEKTLPCTLKFNQSYPTAYDAHMTFCYALGDCQCFRLPSSSNSHWPHKTWDPLWRNGKPTTLVFPGKIKDVCDLDPWLYNLDLSSTGKPPPCDSFLIICGTFMGSLVQRILHFYIAWSFKKQDHVDPGICCLLFGDDDLFPTNVKLNKPSIMLPFSHHWSYFRSGLNSRLDISGNIGDNAIPSDKRGVTDFMQESIFVLSLACLCQHSIYRSKIHLPAEVTDWLSGYMFCSYLQGLGFNSSVYLFCSFEKGKKLGKCRAVERVSWASARQFGEAVGQFGEAVGQFGDQLSECLAMEKRFLAIQDLSPIHSSQTSFESRK